MSLRRFEETDLEALVAFIARAKPREAMSAEQLTAQWRFATQTKTMQRILAWDGDVIVGSVGFGYTTAAPHEPWYFKLVVAPDGRHGEIAARLFDHVVSQRGACELRCQVREDDALDVAFLAARGFVEYARQWESELDLTTCDPASRPLPDGLTLTTLAEHGHDEGFVQALHQLFAPLLADVPSAEPPPTASLATFRETMLNPKLRRPELFQLSLAGDVPVALLVHREDGLDGTALQIDFLGVRRDYRDRGVALALKLAGMRAAKALGYRTIRTWNDTANQPVLSLNERLGFVRQPAWIHFALRS